MFKGKAFNYMLQSPHCKSLVKFGYASSVKSLIDEAKSFRRNMGTTNVLAIRLFDTKEKAWNAETLRKRQWSRYREGPSHEVFYLVDEIKEYISMNQKSSLQSHIEKIINETRHPNQIHEAWDHAEEIIDRYSNGEPTTTLSNHFGCGKRLICRILETHGIERRRSKRAQDANRSSAWDHEKEISQRYINGENGMKLANEYGCGKSTLYRILEANLKQEDY